MQFLFRLFLSFAVAFASAAPAAADAQYFFRYKPALAGMSAAPGNPELPGEQEDPGDYDVTVRFFGVVGEPFESVVPTKPGAVVSYWNVVRGILPQGLGLGDSTGAVSGVPEEAVESRELLVRGYGPSGEMGALAKVTIDIAEPRSGARYQEIYGHTGKTFFTEVSRPASADVYEWVPDVALPQWASLVNGYLQGTPPSAGAWPLALSGRDRFGHETAFAYGQILVEDGPVVAFVPDQLRHRDQTFSVTASVKRRMGKLRWEMEGTLPRDLSFDAESGRISGSIPTFETAGIFRLKAVDVDGASGWSNEFRVGTWPADVSLKSVDTRHLTVNKAASFGFAAEEMVGAQEWRLAGKGLPDGLQMDPVTGRISGVPVKAGTWSDIVLEVSTSASGTDRSNAFSMVVHPDLLTATVAPTHVRVGQPFETPSPVPSGGKAPYSYTVQEGGSLPDGVALDAATGRLSGAVMASGNQSVTMNVIDSTGRPGTPFTAGLTGYGELSASIAPHLTGTRLVAFSAAPAIPAYSAIPDASWSISGGQLPAGLSFDPAAATISGTPTVTGFYGPYVLSVTDGSGTTASTQAFDMEFADYPALAVSASDRDVPRGIAQDVQLASALSPIGKPRFSLASGTLPEGLSLEEDGRLSGTSMALGSFSGIVIRATDGEGRSALGAPVTLTMVQPGAIEATGVEFRWAKGIAFSTPGPRLVNAVEPVVWEAVSGTGLLTLDTETGSLSGALDEPGTFGPYALRATDAMGRVADAAVTVVIVPAIEAALPPVIEAARLSSLGPVRPAVQNAVGKVSHSLSGSLPDGVAFDASSGSIAGHPVEEGSFPVMLTLRDSAGQSLVLPSQIVVGPRLDLQVAYSFPTLFSGKPDGLPRLPSVSNAAGQVSYEASGILPPGIQFDRTTGAFSGTPSQPGKWEGITVSATDTEGGAASAGPFAITVTLADQIEVSDPVRLTARSGSYFVSSPVPVHNALAPLSFSSASGQALDDPDGIVLIEGSGELAGTPSTTGLRSYLVNVTDALSRSRLFNLQLNVVGDLAVAMVDVTASRGTAVSASPQASNVVGQGTYSLVPGALPRGLTFNPSTGTIAGIPLDEGSYGPYTVAVSDRTGEEAVSGSFSIAVTPRKQLAVSYSMPQLFAGSSLGTRLPSVQNAIGNVSYSMTGTLPPGVQFTAGTGAFSGTPLQAGVWEDVTVTAVDSDGSQSEPAVVTFAVTLSGQVSIASTVTRTVRAGRAFSTEAVPVGNAVNPLAFSSSEIGGLSLDQATGSLSGTIGAAGTSIYAMTVADAEGRQKDFQLKLVAVGPLSVSQPDIAAEQYVDMAVTPVTANAVGTRAYSLSPSVLPTGLAFDEATGRISGTPTAEGSFGPYRITVADGLGDAASSAPFGLTVGPRREMTASFPASSTTAVTFRNFGYSPSVANAVGTVTWTMEAGTLPSGLVFSAATGRISGTPSLTGTWPGIVLKATDSASGTAVTGPLSISVVTNGQPISLSTTGIEVKPGMEFETTKPAVSNAVGDYYFLSPQAEALGLELDPLTGVISGSLVNVGRNIIDLVVTDATDRVTSVPQVVEVMPHLRATAKPLYATVNTTINPFQAVTYEYAYGAVTYELNGILPPGLEFTDNGRITGRPTLLGRTEGLTVTATDASGDRAVSNPFFVEVLDNGKIPTITGLSNSSPTIRAGTNYPDIVTPSVSYKKTGDVYVINKPLPAGLTLDSTTGTISGTPSTESPGIYDGYVISVADTLGRGTSSAEFTISVRYAQIPEFLPLSGYFRENLPFVTDPVTISANAYAFVGKPRYSWLTSIPGATVDIDTGAVSGMFTTTSSRTGTIRVSDDTGPITSLNVTMTRKAMSIVLDPLDVEAGSPVDIFPTVSFASQDPGPFTLEAETPGAVPAGISMNPDTGRISGTMPIGTYTLRARISDTGASAVSGWVTWRGTSNAPFDLPFTTLTGQESNTLVMSDILPVTGFQAPSTASISAIEGVGASFRVCYDPECATVKYNWSTATRSVDNGDFVQMRATVSSSNNDRFTFRLAVAGAGYGDWSVISGERALPDASTRMPVSGLVLSSLGRLYDGLDATVMNVTSSSTVTFDFGEEVAFDRFWAAGSGQSLVLDAWVVDRWVEAWRGALSSGREIVLDKAWGSQLVRLRGSSGSATQIGEFRLGAGPAIAQPFFEVSQDKKLPQIGNSAQALQIAASAGENPYGANSLKFTFSGSAQRPTGMSLDLTTGVLTIPSLQTSGGGSWYFTIRIMDDFGFIATKDFEVHANSGVDAATQFPSGQTIISSHGVARLYDGNDEDSVITVTSSSNTWMTLVFATSVDFDRIYLGNATTTARGYGIDAYLGGQWRLIADGTAAPGGQEIVLDETWSTKQIRVRGANSTGIPLSELRVGAGPALPEPPSFDPSQDKELPQIGSTSQAVQIKTVLNANAYKENALTYAVLTSTPRPTGLSINAATGILTIPSLQTSGGGSWFFTIRIMDDFGFIATKDFEVHANSGVDAATQFPSGQTIIGSHGVARLYDGNVADSAITVTSSSNTWMTIVFASAVDFDRIYLGNAATAASSYKIEAFSGGAWHEIASGMAAPGGQEVVLDRVWSASQIRVRGTNSTGIPLSELRVGAGPALPEPPSFDPSQDKELPQIGSTSQAVQIRTILNANDYKENALTYIKSSGTWPTGMSLNASTGVLTIPSLQTSGGGSWFFTIRIMDDFGFIATKDFEVHANSGVDAATQFPAGQSVITANQTARLYDGDDTTTVVNVSNSSATWPRLTFGVAVDFDRIYLGNAATGTRAYTIEAYTGGAWRQIANGVAEPGGQVVVLDRKWSATQVQVKGFSTALPLSEFRVGAGPALPE